MCFPNIYLILTWSLQTDEDYTCIDTIWTLGRKVEQGRCNFYLLKISRCSFCSLLHFDCLSKYDVQSNQILMASALAKLNSLF